MYKTFRLFLSSETLCPVRLSCKLSMKFSDLFSCLPCPVKLSFWRHCLPETSNFKGSFHCRMFTQDFTVRSCLQKYNKERIFLPLSWNTCMGYVRSAQTSGSENFKLHSGMDDPDVKRGMTKKTARLSESEWVYHGTTEIHCNFQIRLPVSSQTNHFTGWDRDDCLMPYNGTKKVDVLWIFDTVDMGEVVGNSWLQVELDTRMSLEGANNHNSRSSNKQMRTWKYGSVPDRKWNSNVTCHDLGQKGEKRRIVGNKVWCVLGRTAIRPGVSCDLLLTGFTFTTCHDYTTLFLSTPSYAQYAFFQQQSYPHPHHQRLYPCP